MLLPHLTYRVSSTMLPDFPKLKKDFQQRLIKEGRAGAERGIVGRISKRSLWEGKKWATIYPDGSRDESELHETSRTLMFKDEELSILSQSEIEEKFLGTMNSINEEIEKGVLKTISDAAEHESPFVKRSTNKFTGEDFLAMLEKSQIDFDRFGNPYEQIFITSPTVGREMQAEQERLKDDPEFDRRHSEIMARKKREFDEREANRCLVG
jgi:hypothetical protein